MRELEWTLLENLLINSPLLFFNSTSKIRFGFPTLPWTKEGERHSIEWQSSLISAAFETDAIVDSSSRIHFSILSQATSSWILYEFLGRRSDSEWRSTRTPWALSHFRIWMKLNRGKRLKKKNRQVVGKPDDWWYSGRGSGKWCFWFKCSWRSVLIWSSLPLQNCYSHLMTVTRSGCSFLWQGQN